MRTTIRILVQTRYAGKVARKGDIIEALPHDANYLVASKMAERLEPVAEIKGMSTATAGGLVEGGADPEATPPAETESAPPQAAEDAPAKPNRGRKRKTTT